MSGQQSETGDTSFERLAGGICRLERLLRTLRVSGKTVLYDLAVVDFSSQVLEAAKATILLQLSEVPRVSWTTARLSFEAMHDLFYLVQLCPDRLEAGARVYVSALAAKAKSRGILDRAAREAEIEAPPDDPGKPTLREFVREEAEDIETLSPGSKDAILKVLDDRLSGGDRHWSGLPRKQMTKRIRKELEGADLASMFEAYYDAISVSAHPRLRIGEAVSIDGTSVRIRSADDVPNDASSEIACACVQTVEKLLEKYLAGEDAP